MMKSMSKILSLVMILTLVSSPAAYAGKCNFYKDNQQCKNIESGSADKSGHGAQFCKYLKKSQSTCKWELGTAITYTVLSVACGTACAMQYIPATKATGAADAMKAACNIATLAAGAGDMAYGFIMKSQVKKEAAKDMEIIGRDYWVDKWGGSAAGSLNFLATATASGAIKVLTTGGENASKTLSDANKSSDTDAMVCVTAAMNGIIAGMKYANRGKIVENAKANVDQLKQLENAAGQSGNLIGQQEISTFTPMDGSGGDPAVIQDLRTSPSIANSDGEIPTTADMASFATAENGKMFATPDANKFKEAFDNLAGLGLTPELIADSLESKGVAGTIDSLVGDNAASDAIADLVNEAVSSSGGNVNNALAYESSKSEGGGGKKESSDPFAALLGNRGPAAAGSGGLHEIKFGGFDIWHAGTTQSIFEIVSKKTQDVSSRLK